jgi:hypothetical protein
MAQHRDDHGAALYHAAGRHGAPPVPPYTDPYVPLHQSKYSNPGRHGGVYFPPAVATPRLGTYGGGYTPRGK